MSSIRSLWIRWKMLRLPWRKKFLIGEDLVGNTYWEFKDALSHNRWRRMVKSRTRNIHHADVQVSPQWHQWLRQTRIEPPTFQEQQMDVVRQAQLAHNARLADERWAAKAKYIEKPKEPVPSPSDAAPKDPKTGETAGIQSAVTSTSEQTKEDPWNQERQKQKETASNPGSTWQPASWTPKPGAKKR